MNYIVKIAKLLCLLVVLLSLGCDKSGAPDPTANPVPTPKKDALYIPILQGAAANSYVLLTWGVPNMGYQCCDLPIYTVDHFEVLAAETDPAQLQFLANVPKTTFQFALNNLINGKYYYYAIKIVGINGESMVSKPIMVIPEIAITYQNLQVSTADSYSGTFAPNLSKVAYQRQYIYDNGTKSVTSVIVRNLLNSTETLLELDAYAANWSPSGDKIVYQKQSLVANLGNINDLCVYTVVNSGIKKLTNSDNNNYFPVWSPDEKSIAFLSNRTVKEKYNLYKMLADGTAVTQLATNISLKSINWTNDGNNILYVTKDQSANNDFDIYSISANGTGGATALVKSMWNEICPSSSPDGQSLAFISDRSGFNEVWIMNLQTKKLKQVTNTTNQSLISPFTGSLEWRGNKLLVTAGAVPSGISGLYTINP